MFDVGMGLRLAERAAFHYAHINDADARCCQRTAEEHMKYIADGCVAKNHTSC